MCIYSVDLLVCDGVFAGSECEGFYTNKLFFHHL